MTTATSPSNASNDHLLTGPILPLLLKFSLPNMVAMVVTALATMAETRYVGQLGASALAGMALVFPFVMLQTMLSAGAMGGGVSSAVSRALGAGDGKSANALAVHALWISVAAGAVFLVVMETFGHALMALLGGRDDALEQALAYGEVSFAGSIFVWVVNMMSSVIRGSGNMRVPSMTLLCVAVMQVLLAGALGLGWFSLPALGMQGVAAGGVLANAVGACFLWAYLTYGPGLVRLNVRSTAWCAQHFFAILKVGLVACLSPFQTVLTILILTKLVTSFGTQALAGYGIGTRLEFLLVPIAFAVGVASVPLVGMAIGAGHVARARKVAWVAACLATALLGALGAVVAYAPDLWTTLYSQEPAVMASSAHYFLWAGPCYGLFGLGLSLYFSSLGAGRALGPVLAGTLRLLVVAVGAALLTQWDSPVWMVFALVGIGMAAYGLSTVVFIKLTPWDRG
jgi:putative MATE family efflux protein